MMRLREQTGETLIFSKTYALSKGFEQMPQNSLPVLFSQFLQEKEYLYSASQNTLRYYKAGFKVFQLSEPITQQQLNNRVLQLRKEGMKISCLNVYMRSVNSFARWLFENGHVTEHLKLKKLPYVEKPLRTFSDSRIQTILNRKPKTKGEQRLLALLNLLTDSGLRIEEALNLKRENVDLQNLLIDVVKGKGGKFRRIPFSLRCRTVLFKQMRSHDYGLVFCNREGGKLRYENGRRDFVTLVDQLGIDVDGCFHAFRRYFATHAIRHNQNPYLLMRARA
ncbi:MAG TPA: tyrosine-type recombinase/integrase [Pyrinomonadaceae bacterium]|nr:tyrosine-type recombinase/integrase [Pyrinomonadaceae bacterium]